MYAVIKSGGKQYTVKPGDVLRVEKIEADLGSELQLTDVVMVGGEKVFVGADINKAVVTVVVTNHQRAPKVIVFKKKRRQGYRRMGGHRQPYTELFVKSITNPEGQVAKADSSPSVFSPEKREQRLQKRAEKIEQVRRQARATEGDGSAAPAKKSVKKSRAAGPARKASAKKTAGKRAGAKKTAGKSAKKTKKK
jgi:large subunit ribosomal protein L21